MNAQTLNQTMPQKLKVRVVPMSVRGDVVIRTLALVRAGAARVAAYLRHADADIDMWRRLEFRNEYQDPREPRMPEIHRRY